MVRSLYKLALAWGIALTLFGSLSAMAHHSFSGQFDSTKQVAFEGIVKRVEWQNPHVWIYVDAEDEEGNITHWEAEATNPNTLLRRGWGTDTVKAGDRVSVEGFRAICCEHVMNARTVILSDGRKVFSGSAP